MSGSLWIVLSILVGLLILEVFAPNRLLEGFQQMNPGGGQAAPTPANDPTNNFLTNRFDKRGDITPHSEEGGYMQDGRYFADWMDVQRLGSKRDYCRVVFPMGAGEETSFFACALAGTNGQSSIVYKSKTVKDGLKLGRDDYINTIRGDGRDAYCRILRQANGQFAPMCLAADDFAFSDKDVLDTKPPEEITTLLDFYRGCRLWFRFRDDMLDYIKGSIVQAASGLAVDDTPRAPRTKGLVFNGKDQFLRIGDSPDLSLGNEGSLRSVRAFTVWVKFDEFTNNAHIFDFGNGQGVDNVFLGILGAGDADSAGGNTLRPDSACASTTVPTSPSGAKWCPEMRAPEALLSSSGNIDEYTCTGSESTVDPAQAEPISVTKKKPTGQTSRATLLFEIWDARLRKMQLKINGAIPKGEWTHIAITAKGMDAMRPDILVYVNGELLYTQEAGFLPQNAITQINYIGKSNWTDAGGEYELRDELFKGSIFDFRMYNASVSEQKLKKIVHWGKKILGLHDLNA